MQVKGLSAGLKLNYLQRKRTEFLYSETHGVRLGWSSVCSVLARHAGVVGSSSSIT